MSLSKLSTETLMALDRHIAVLDNKIQTAEQQNKRRSEYQEKYLFYKERVDVLREYEQRIQFLHKTTMARMEKFRDDCIQQLEDRVKTILDIVFPDEDFRVSITFKPYRGSYQSEVLIGKLQSNGRIKWGRPKSRNGGFVKQLTSFSVVSSMNLLMGSKMIMLDEPFSSSDPHNVSRLKPVFEMMLANGLQILLIEHKEHLFSGIDHNEILLYKHRHPTDEHKGFVEIVSNERKFANDHNIDGTDGSDSNIQDQ